MEYNSESDSCIESSMLKSCLLFSGKNIRNNRKLILQKKILSLLFQNKITKQQDIEKYCFEGIDESTTEESSYSSALRALQQRKLVVLDDEGNIKLSDKTERDANTFSQEYRELRDKTIDDIYKEVCDSYNNSINNPASVKINILCCLEYYFKTSALQLLGYDEKNEDVSNKLINIAVQDLSEKNKDLDQYILFSIGKLVDEPNAEQKKFLEISARVALTSHIIGVDPLLRNFRQNTIGSKTFVLDTDVVLYCLSKYTKRGKFYRKMISRLSQFGCKLYIPDEVIDEVYDHAEAATKRYAYQGTLIENADSYVIINKGTNVFIEDYLSGNLKGSAEKWNLYIRNYFDLYFGKTLIRELIKDIFKNKVEYGRYPNNQNVDSDSIDFKKLYESILNSTLMSPNARFRDVEKNRKIALVDTNLYLAVKMANLSKVRDDIPKKKSGILKFDYYVLTSSIRSHSCAESLGIEYAVLCSPRAMIGYLSETGLFDDNEVNISDLFDNPFMGYLVHESWDTIENIIKAGIDVRGKGLVRLRLDLEKTVHELLTSTDPESLKTAYNDVVDKGYDFDEHIKTVMEESIANAKENAELKSQLDEKNKIIENLKKKDGKDKYLKRLGQNKKASHN